VGDKKNIEELLARAHAYTKKKTHACARTHTHSTHTHTHTHTQELNKMADTGGGGARGGEPPGATRADVDKWA